VTTVTGHNTPGCIAFDAGSPEVFLTISTRPGYRLVARIGVCKPTARILISNETPSSVTHRKGGELKKKKRNKYKKALHGQLGHTDY